MLCVSTMDRNDAPLSVATASPVVVIPLHGEMRVALRRVTRPLEPRTVVRGEVVTAALALATAADVLAVVRVVQDNVVCIRQQQFEHDRVAAADQSSGRR